MRRAVLSVLLLALLLTGCGGSAADTTVADPPKSTALANSDNTKINKLVADWKAAVPAEMKAQAVKDPIEEKVYQSTASLQEIDEYYKQLTTKSWVQSTRMPGVKDGVLLTGYDLGSTTLVVGAVDATQLGGSGVIIYTAKGAK